MHSRRRCPARGTTVNDTASREAALDIAREVYACESIHAAIADSTLDAYRAIAARAAAAVHRRQQGMRLPIVLGICGSQGSGKSTTARVVERLLATQFALSAATLSLDDLYLSRQQRERLATSVHPLLATRGVPGTHDVARGLALIDELGGANATHTTRLPRFDKSRDELSDEAGWAVVSGRPDVLIFEGWCVGATAQLQAELVHPINALERDADADGRWRGYVNSRLASDYRRLFERIDSLVLLRAPDFSCVVHWRQEQENKLAARLRARTRQALGWR